MVTAARPRRTAPAGRALKAPRTRAEALARVLATDRALDRPSALARDPLRFVRRYASREDREIAALACALLAFGNVTTIGRKLHELLVDRLGDAPARVARDPAGLAGALATFVHRTFRGPDLARLLAAAGRIQSARGSLYEPLVQAFAGEGSLRAGLVAWTDALRVDAFGPRPTRAQRHLLPDPSGASACKRLALLCRWIARPDDGVDLGLVAIPTRALVVPLDVHVHRVARSLGFTRRRAASWNAALEVTAALSALDPDDPVRFDFALCHTEIAKGRKKRA